MTDTPNPTGSAQPAWVKFLKYAAIMIAVLGVLLGLLALFAPLGVWVEAWDFRRGFAILGVVYNSALWVVLVGLLLGLTMMFITLKRIANLRPWLGWIATGTLIAYIAWSIPNAYRPAPEANVPPIHDITTNPDNPPKFEAVLPLRGEGTNSVEYGGAENMTAEKLAQLQRDAYPHIQPQQYQQSASAVFERALEVARDSGWEIVATEPERGRIEATDTTFWFRFKDDVVIEIADSGAGSVLNARSISRVGVSDVGKNAARLQTFFQAMTAGETCCELRQ